MADYRKMLERNMAMMASGTIHFNMNRKNFPIMLSISILSIFQPANIENASAPSVIR